LVPLFFLSQFGSCFGKFDLNLALSVSGTITLNGTPHVSSWIFWFFFKKLFLFFYLFLEFFKNIKNMPRVKLQSCHVAVTEWCGNDNATCQYYAKCHFLILNLVHVFKLLSQFSPYFCKNNAILFLSRLKQKLIFI